MFRPRSIPESLENDFIDSAKKGDMQLAVQLAGQEPRLIEPMRLILHRALIGAVRSHQVDMAAWLLSLGADADQLSNEERNISLLQFAVYHQHTGMVECLLPYIKKIDHLNRDGKTALHYAIEMQNRHICRLLIHANASINCRAKDQKGRVPRSQIGCILKSGCVDIAKDLFEHRPSALSEFMKIYPDIIGYICQNAEYEDRVREQMIQYLLSECPIVLMPDEQLPDIATLQQIGESLNKAGFLSTTIELYLARIQLSAFLQRCRPQDGQWINKQLKFALEDLTVDVSSLMAHDLIMAVEGKHPLISQQRFKNIFRDLLAVFITPPNGRVNAQFGKVLYAACGHLNNSTDYNDESVEVLKKLTLLVLLQTISHSKEDVYGQLVHLLKMMIPSARTYPSTGYGQYLLEQFVNHYSEEVEALIMNIKQFYCEYLHIKLSDHQVNPCSKLEVMVQLSKAAKVQREYSALQKQASELQRDFVQQAESLRNLQGESEQMSLSLRQLQGKYSELSSNRMSIKIIHEQLQTDNEQLKKELADLQASTSVGKKSVKGRKGNQRKAKPAPARQARDRDEGTVIDSSSSADLGEIEMPVIKRYKLFVQPGNVANGDAASVPVKKAVVRRNSK